MKLIYSSSPHIRGNRTTRNIMIDVCIALVPASIMACVYFGINALGLILVAIVGALASEVIFRLCQKVPFKKIMKEFDFTSLVTGLLVGLNMPPFSFITYWYIPLLSSIFAIIVVKMLFGGTGANIVNPAIAGRAFALMSFTIVMTSSYVMPNINGLFNNVEPVTGATALTEILNGTAGSGGYFNMGLTLTDLLLGTGVAGTIGETCKLALIAGGIYLAIRKVIDVKLPLLYIGVTGLFTVALNGFNIYHFLPSILSGGLILGAIFMATDYVTTPNTKIGNIIYFVCLGLLTAGLRKACKMEVVSFAILLMNLIVPLIDKYIVPKPFGYVKPAKKGVA